MLVFQWITIGWVPWAIWAVAWAQAAGGESQQQPVCAARDPRELETAIMQWPTCVETRWRRKPNEEPTSTPIPTPTLTSISTSHGSQRATSETSADTASVETGSASTPGQGADQELDTDSPLDNANFLSFEDWKRQNLAKAGQSAENVGGNRRAGVADKDRQRPTGINNALDALGDDAEIELDFAGFGAGASEAAKTATAWGNHVPSSGGSGAQVASDTGPEAVDTPGHGVPAVGSKDAGTTCKERFNYASFDCAATVLKTNPQAKGSSAVLIENKDSYMLNECRANNKFLILELCDDILVDTVVLANYEFFSSIFHTFRVSVADRYPAKPDQWKELGVYEARNTREIQAFPVQNPLIWARYLRIEFLTHYGHEFYCPLSLIRVHGTTMLEEYKHDGEANRVEEVAKPVSEPVLEADTDPRPPESPITHTEHVEIHPVTPEPCRNHITPVELVLLGMADYPTCGIQGAPVEPTATLGDVSPETAQASLGMAAPSTEERSTAVWGEKAASSEAGEKSSPGPAGANVHPPFDNASSAATPDAAPDNVTAEANTRAISVSKGEQIAESIRATTTQPPSPNPTTQESFFKSVNKRLQMLESNSSLSLQYIEEQSRILRDAFSKVEKRQLSKTSTFLENLNVTVVSELKQFREQYDQVWKSVALEFEHQRIQYHMEIHSLSTQLGVLADEIVFQKRVAVIQSIVVLFCFGLVLFTRGAAGAYIDLPSVQSMVSRSYSLRPSSPIFGSLPGSPGSTRPTSSYRKTSHRRQLSEDSQGESLSPTVAYAPPTPTSDNSSVRPDAQEPTPSASADSLSAPAAPPPLVRSSSSPPDLNGENEGAGEEVCEELESESECSDSEGQ
ncbi:UNC-like C-terminal-domain-containing protein [Aspergillus crustosus]